MKQRGIIILLFFFIIIVILSGCKIVESKEGVIINEICSSNSKLLPTSNYEYYDWIELYNTTEKDIYLKNYFLSDSSKDLKKFIFPNISIKSNDYLIVYCDSNNFSSPDLIIAPFGLSSSGEKLYLSMPNGKICDEVSFPEIPENKTYGRYNSSFQILNPSPLEKNENYCTYRKVNKPNFSMESGFYNQAFYLELQADEDIYYTLDSSIPTISSNKYNPEDKIFIPELANINDSLRTRNDITTSTTLSNKYVDKCTVVRAKCIAKDGNESEVVTQSYFVNKADMSDKEVISLVSDSSNLFDKDRGIYVKGSKYEDYELNPDKYKNAPVLNWDQEGRDWERECSITLFKDKTVDFSQDCGIRVRGWGGRSKAIKSLTLNARKCYGEKYFPNNLFDNEVKTKSLILKYDRFSNSKEKFRDGFLQSLMAGTSVSTQQYKMVIVFINGEYWENYMLMEKYDNDYFEAHYGVDKDDVVIVKDDKLDTGLEADKASYEDFKKYVKNTDFSYEKNYQNLLTKIDINSFIDCYIAQTYYSNFDFSYKKNFIMWRSRNCSDELYKDGKWRFCLYDLDTAASRLHYTDPKDIIYDYTFNPFTGEYLFATDMKNDIFLNSFMKSAIFRKQFVLEAQELIDSRFKYEDVINKLKLQYNYNDTQGKLIDFFHNRKDYYIKYLKEYFKVN